MKDSPALHLYDNDEMMKTLQKDYPVEEKLPTVFHLQTLVPQGAKDKTKRKLKGELNSSGHTAPDPNYARQVP